MIWALLFFYLCAGVLFAASLCGDVAKVAVPNNRLLDDLICIPLVAFLGLFWPIVFFQHKAVMRRDGL